MNKVEKVDKVDKLDKVDKVESDIATFLSGGFHGDLTGTTPTPGEFKKI